MFSLSVFWIACKVKLHVESPAKRPNEVRDEFRAVGGDDVKVVVSPSILSHIITVPIDSIFQTSPPYLIGLGVANVSLTTGNTGRRGVGGMIHGL